MTDLERVTRTLEELDESQDRYYGSGVKAGRETANKALEAELAELREDRDRLKSNLLALDTAAVKRYDELREAVRRWYSLLSNETSEADLDRLRQLIEEKPDPGPPKHYERKY